MTANEKKWTLVRHTGFSAGGKEEFKHAVEVRAVKELVAERVARFGGCVFEDYAAAQKAEQYENYPPETGDSIVPCCRGSFIRVKGTEEEVYIPARKRS